MTQAWTDWSTEKSKKMQRSE